MSVSLCPSRTVNAARSNATRMVTAVNNNGGSAVEPAKEKILAERFKTQMCRNYERKGSCPYENKCMFAHGEADMRTPEMNVRDGLFTEESIEAYRRAQRLLKKRANQALRQAEKKRLEEAADAEASTIEVNTVPSAAVDASRSVSDVMAASPISAVSLIITSSPFANTPASAKVFTNDAQRAGRPSFLAALPPAAGERDPTTFHNPAGAALIATSVPTTPQSAKTAIPSTAISSASSSIGEREDLNESVSISTYSRNGGVAVRFGMAASAVPMKPSQLPPRQQPQPQQEPLAHHQYRPHSEPMPMMNANHTQQQADAYRPNHSYTSGCSYVGSSAPNSFNNSQYRGNGQSSSNFGFNPSAAQLMQSPSMMSSVSSNGVMPRGSYRHNPYAARASFN